MIDLKHAKRPQLQIIIKRLQDAVLHPYTSEKDCVVDSIFDVLFIEGVINEKSYKFYRNDVRNPFYGWNLVGERKCK